MMSTRGEAEKILEEWAAQHNIRFRRIREGCKKRPDYWLICPGEAIVVEVKDLAPNSEEKHFDRELEATGYAFHTSTPGCRLRKRIKKAAAKYPPWHKRGIPCVTFVFNNTRFLSSTSGHQVYAAMFGRLSFSVPVAGSEEETMFVAQDGVLTPDSNTSTSAVAVNEWDRRTGFTMIVFHNPYAANELDHLASLPGVRQFKSEDGRGLWLEFD